MIVPGYTYPSTFKQHLTELGFGELKALTKGLSASYKPTYFDWWLWLLLAISDPMPWWNYRPECITSATLAYSHCESKPAMSKYPWRPAYLTFRRWIWSKLWWHDWMTGDIRYTPLVVVSYTMVPKSHSIPADVFCNSTTLVRNHCSTCHYRSSSMLLLLFSRSGHITSNCSWSKVRCTSPNSL